MAQERWFPIKYELREGYKLRKLVGAGDDWQIYLSDQGTRILIATSALGEKWVASGLLHESAMTPLKIGEASYLTIGSGSGQQLAPITEFISPKTKADATAFAVSMRETRLVAEDVPLQDGIYVERLSRLLPTWTVSEKVDDKSILGRWLTGGVSVSTSSFRRLTSLLGWLDRNDVKDVVEAAGIDMPSGIGAVQTKRRKSTPSTADFQKTKSAKHVGDLDDTDGAAIPSQEQEFTLPGRPMLEEFFNEHVVDIVLHEERYKALGINFPSAVVLHGPPGCGKTFAVDRLVEFLDWPVFHIDANSIGSPYIHETSRKVSEVFEKAMEASPAVIVIDEMESFLSDRQLHQSTGLHHVEEVAEFLRRIPEAMSKKVLVVGMTNRLEMIDSAILRRGRFDHVIEVTMPSKKEVTELVTSLLEKMPVETELSLSKAITALTGRPLSDAAFAIREAGRLAARSGKDALDQDNLDAAVARLPDVPDEGKSRPIGFIWN